jgi:hypothetical protein
LKTIPPCFFSLAMYESVRYLIAVCICSAFTAPASINAAPQGFLEGQLKITSARPVELNDENPSRPIDGKLVAAGADYANYPLVVLSQGERKQVVRITADAQGHYRAALPPGDYILDVEGRIPKRLHVRAQPFTIVPHETVHVDITIDTGFAAEASTPQE